MDNLLNHISNNNQDCFFVENIKLSSYIETIKRKLVNPYNNLVFCILDNNDMILSNTNKKDKKYILNQRVIEILTLIEDKDKINSFNYDMKLFNVNKIQVSVQDSLKNKTNLSTILFFNDYYNIHFVIVDYIKKEYFETTFKKYDKNYIIFSKNKIYLYNDYDLTDYKIKNIKELNLINKDIINIYKNYLGPISKYKINDLKEIANKNNISLFQNGKSKIKKVLYEEINNYYLNLI